MKQRTVWVLDGSKPRSGAVVDRAPSDRKGAEDRILLRLHVGPAKLGLERTYNVKSVYPSKRAALREHVRQTAKALRRALADEKRSVRWHQTFVASKAAEWKRARVQLAKERLRG